MSVNAFSSVMESDRSSPSVCSSSASSCRSISSRSIVRSELLLPPNMLFHRVKGLLDELLHSVGEPSNVLRLSLLEDESLLLESKLSLLDDELLRANAKV